MPPRADPPPHKLAAWAGALGVACATLGGAIIAPVWLFPGTRTTTLKIASFALTHRTELLTGMFLNTAGVSLWLVFAAGIWSYLHGKAGADSFLSACFGLGMVGMVAMLLTGFVAMFVLTYRAGPAAEARTLYDLAFGLLAISAAPTAIALAAYAALIIGTRSLPRSTERLAVLAAVAHVLLLFTFLPRSGFFSLEGQVITAIPATLFVWITGTSIAMLSVAKRPNDLTSSLTHAPRPGATI